MDEVIGQENVVNMMKAFIEQEEQGIHELPHFLFSGTTGVGKTATSIAFAKDLWGDDWRSNWIDFNASDERGIDTVRNEIKQYAKQRGISSTSFKIIFLDEVDSMTDDAQRALRRTMEDYSEFTKFILCCNHPSKLLDAIRGRCVERTFSPVDKDVLSKHLKYICDSEGITYEDSALDLLAEKTNGKVRNALQELQALATLGEITTEWVEDQLSTITKDEIRSIYTILKSPYPKDDKMSKVDREIAKLYQSGVGARDILVEFYNYILNNQPEMVKTLAKIGDIDSNISQGANPLLQLRCFMAWIIQRTG